MTNGHSFAGWSGAASGSSLSASVTLDRNRTATASFNCRLTVNAGSGGTASGGGIHGCDTSPPVTARVTNGYSFAGWSGAASGSSLSATATLGRNRTATASFNCRLTVRAGLGGTASGGGIHGCGTTPTVTAIVTNGYSFAGWSGAASGTSLSTTATLGRNRTATASFNCRLTVTSTSGGTASGGGVYSCGTTRTVTADPDDYFYLKSWTGASGTSTTASVYLSRNKAVRAVFDHVCNDEASARAPFCLRGAEDPEPDAPP